MNRGKAHRKVTDMKHEKLTDASTPFADLNGQLYVRLQAVMNPLVALSDGLPVSFFNGESNGYLKIEDAIKFCEKEPGSHCGHPYTELLAACHKAVELYNANKITGSGKK